MKPITFACKETLPLPPHVIAEQILDLSRWPEFHGCWPIPGVKAAEFEIESPNIVGTRIRVTNRDGSTHVEEIVEWQPDQKVELHMSEFSAPLSRLATGFDETWRFDRGENGTTVTRSFQIHAKSRLTRLPLRLIAFLLKRAIAHHLREMKETAKPIEVRPTQ